MIAFRALSSSEKKTLRSSRKSSSTRPYPNSFRRCPALLSVIAPHRILIRLRGGAACFTNKKGQNYITGAKHGLAFRGFSNNCILRKGGILKLDTIQTQTTGFERLS